MVTPASNSVIIALVQDALPLARKLTAKDAFLRREAVMQLAMSMQFNFKGDAEELAAMPAGPTHEATGFVDWLGAGDAQVRGMRACCADGFLPAPAILKGTTWHTNAAGVRVKTVHPPMWTGKQIVSWMLPWGLCLQKVLDDGLAPLEGWVPAKPLATLRAERAALAELERAARAETDAKAETDATSDAASTDKTDAKAETVATSDAASTDKTVAKAETDAKTDARAHLHDKLRAARDADKALASMQSWLDEDNVVVIKDGELLCGRLCKQTVGRVANGIVHALWRQFGPWAAAKWVSDAQRVLNLYGMTHTVCVSITDCVPPLETEARVNALVAEAIGQADALLHTRAPAYVVEVRTHKILQQLMRDAGALVLKTMHESNGIYQVVKSGAKGGLQNIAQIAALLGPQSVFGSRVRMRRAVSGLRTLPNFAPNDASPEARGFVSNSLLRGLAPSEYFFHMMAAREGVINTSINTAETGYSYNRMVQGEQSAAIMYDGSVRAGNYQLVTLHYGGDDYDGGKLERVNVPAIMWSDTQVHARLGSQWSQLVRGSGCDGTGRDTTERDASHDMEHDATHDGAMQKDTEAYLHAEADLLVKARDVLRTVRVGLGDTVHTHFALPVSLDTLVEVARLATRHVKEDTRDTARRVAHLATRTLQFLRFIVESHDGLAARKTPRPSLPADAPLAQKLELALLRRDDPHTAYGDPSMVARAVYVTQLASGNMLRRHKLSEAALDWLLLRAARMYRKALVAPGEGVGALGASSMGEPSTQLTLNTESHLACTLRVFCVRIVRAMWFTFTFPIVPWLLCVCAH
jgi:hypothetical protein